MYQKVIDHKIMQKQKPAVPKSTSFTYSQTPTVRKTKTTAKNCISQPCLQIGVAKI